MAADKLPADGLAKCYVLWDLVDKDCETEDPRILCHALHKVLDRLGHVSGIFAYSTLKQSKRIPAYFLRTYGNVETSSNEGSAEAAARSQNGRQQAEDLGRVAFYHNSRGRRFVLSLDQRVSYTYVLEREGVEMRILRGPKTASEQMMRGIARLLRDLVEGNGENAEILLCIVSDRITADMVRNVKRSGIYIIVIAEREPDLKYADAFLGWESLKRLAK